MSVLEATRITCQKWYNELLAERKTAYEQRGEIIGKYQQLRRVKEHKASSPWAKEAKMTEAIIVLTSLSIIPPISFGWRQGTRGIPGSARNPSAGIIRIRFSGLEPRFLSAAHAAPR